MATQQAASLHPFVTDMYIVDPTRYPEITYKNITTGEWCPPVIVNDFNLYTIVTEAAVEGGGQARLVKFQRQDFHEQYFTAENATLKGSLSPIVFTDADSGAEYFNPILIYDSTLTRRILFMLVNLPTSDQMVLSAYQVNDGSTLNDGSTGGPHDLIKLWTGNNTGNKTWSPRKTDMNHYGIFLGKGADDGFYIYWYKIDGSLLSIRKFNRLTGAEGDTILITLNQPYTYCKLTMSNFDTDTFYITVRTGDILSMASCRFSTKTVSIFVEVAVPLSTSLPANIEILPFSKGTGTDAPYMCSAVYGYNYDSNNILRIAYLPNIIDKTATPYRISGLETPFYYNINKFDLFSEVANASQSDMTLSVITNPNNADFMYIAYVATTSQIRIVKIYRNAVADKIYETHVPIVMWGTRLGVIPDSLNGKIGINVDKEGNAYVFTWSTQKEIKISLLKEYIMDLGHTEASVVAPVDTIPNMLKTITNEYTIMTPQMGLLYSAFPNVNNVTIDTIAPGAGGETDKLILTLKYINYTYIQAFPTVITSLRTTIENAFKTLYEDSSISVLNLDPLGVNLDGTTTTLNVYLPIGTLKKPCVVKGTEIIRLRMTDQKPERVAVEHINVGDKVLNHVGAYVTVIDHMRSTIYAQEHNAPYLVPRGFFGRNRPYRDLLISGDHGILVSFMSQKNMTVVYAEDINVLKRVLLGKTVDFHHLLLEDHQSNFYLANGLEVDSYHPGAFMRKKMKN